MEVETRCAEMDLRSFTRKPSQEARGRLFRRLAVNLQLFYSKTIFENLVTYFAKRKFCRIFGGHIFFQTLYAGTELGLFDLLHRSPLAFDEIARKLELDEQPCRILLLGLVASGLLRKSGETYRNSALARRLLTKSSSERLISYVKLQHEVIYPAMRHFLDALKKNTNAGLKEIPGNEPTLYQRIAAEPVVEKVFQDAMEELSRHANRSLSRFVDFSGVRSLIDVGGGNGSNIIEIAKAYPKLHAAVFDFPSVCAMAKQNIRANGLSDRLSAIPGDVFNDELPAGADCVIFCHFFTIWSKAENLALLKKAYRALPAGGRVMIFNMMQWDNGKGPMTAAIGSPYFLAVATGRGMLYSWSEYEALFHEAGFRNIRRQRLPRDHGVICGTKPL